MQGYVADYNLLRDCAGIAQTVRWAEAVWTEATRLKIEPEQRRELALQFKSIASRFNELPIWKCTKGNSFQRVDASHCDRIDLLVEWWEASGENCFTERALEMAKIPHQFDNWGDGNKNVGLIRKLREEWDDEDFPLQESLIEVLEDSLCVMLDNGMSSDELDSLSDAIEDSVNILSAKVVNAARRAIRAEFDHVRDIVRGIDSESTLDDHISALQRLAPRAGIDPLQLEKAVEVVKERISELDEETSVAEAPTLSGPKKERDKFDDVDLRNLFQPLLGHV